ncbi:DUF2917 domain-containing protein [Luteolibacter arcticus]|uniref:DUF2917 domain-containing protein n=1 Tax=Luteolibacter arcticus TaxID=1581411 RepID=A0ABT3GEM2_9BACT|nr:DUF2917 domain-containing protein [Luteolibacter arcticus]MCW1921755.1 DUF2917 domain-containing protein [Luteolibacter arcticus]
MQISLKRREVRSFDLAAYDRLRLTTRDGIAWATLEGSANDHALAASSPITFAGPGRVVIESLESDMTVRAEFLGIPARKEVLLATH